METLIKVDRFEAENYRRYGSEYFMLYVVGLRHVEAQFTNEVDREQARS